MPIVSHPAQQARRLQTRASDNDGYRSLNDLRPMTQGQRGLKPYTPGEALVNSRSLNDLRPMTQRREPGLKPYTPGEALVSNGGPGTANRPIGLSFPGSSSQTGLAMTKVRNSYKASGKTVVITGGSQGIGRATALLFARKGYNVVVTARDLTKLQYVADDCEQACGRQGCSLAVACDVTKEEQVKSMASRAMAKYENIDVVVNCAGIMCRGLFSDVPASEAERVMRTNYLGAYIVSQAFLPVLKVEGKRKQGADKPSLIMINAFNGKVSMKHMSAFSATKYALYGLTEALRAEVAQDNIHVGQVYPGVVKSNHLERTTFFGKDVAEDRRSFRQTVRALPISQMPAEVADAVYAATVGKQNDVIVGLPFAAAAAASQATGFNPFASNIPFSLPFPLPFGQ
ncbi:hypothetical protein DUNSADRAFT_8193 [Dunaliella salina]|uniref:Ketoreductase domain-containing protein n=1 Tax=Dunaliella salina TaxID=3046 RepID=A0ABQ7GJU7_DUNSA|nr:hypothetical protein DUNSADRAFT_8193 [Dunaliella salina]|eukprot:KAF5834889.1 hypothetical protein DUNSADRAFT_8193 [Dunaliella salina]